ncbi:DUF2809 domain-containing protein [bacterium]|nr:DUF2809 domain-containing protein [bacterium]
MASKNFRRSRRIVLCLIVCVITTGLASRRDSRLFPQFLHDYPGDAFWAMAAYLGLVLFIPSIGVRRAAAGSLAISFAVELSQLYHDDRIDRIRRTLFGRLILGSGFDWFDLIAYSTGILMIAVFDASVVIPCAERKERIGK